MNDSDAEFTRQVVDRAMSIARVETQHEIERLRAALRAIATHWGEPMPLPQPGRPIDYHALMKMWQKKCRTLQNIARKELGMPMIASAFSDDSEPDH